MILAVLLLCDSAVAAAQQSPQTASDAGGLAGTFVIQKHDNTSMALSGAQVWIFYGLSGGPGCIVEGRVRITDCHVDAPADHFLDAEFACELKYGDQIQQLSHDLQPFKTATNDSQERQREKLANELNAYYIRCGDTAVMKTMALVQKHPKDAWQARVLTTDSDGHWSVADLRPGNYAVIMRAHLSGLDVYSMDIRPRSVEAGKTQIVPPLDPMISDHVPVQ
jgi:hypothetical protein